MKKSFIYTGTGDKGITSLIGGKRIYKADQRIESYGTIDELNSFIGLLSTEVTDEKDKQFLIQIQNKLFTVGSYLATDPKTAGRNKCYEIFPEDIQKIEVEIDGIDATLPKMKGFILPGGTHSAAVAHICRTVCRRAERQIYRLATTEPVEELILVFVNRLSDYLFVLARKECISNKGDEIIWDNTCF